MRRIFLAFFACTVATAAVAQPTSRQAAPWVGVPVTELPNPTFGIPTETGQNGATPQLHGTQRTANDVSDPIIRYYVDLANGQLWRSYDGARIDAAGISNCGSNNVIAAVNPATGILEFDRRWVSRNAAALSIASDPGLGSSTASSGVLILDLDVDGNRFRPIYSSSLTYSVGDANSEPRRYVTSTRGSVEACGGTPTAPVVGFGNSGPPGVGGGTVSPPATVDDDPSEPPAINTIQTLTPSLPAIVALVSSNQSLICSGSVVGSQTILTSAHCMCRSPAPVFAWIGSWAGRALYQGEEASRTRLAGWRLYDRNYCRTNSSQRGYDLALVYTTTTLRIDPKYYVQLNSIGAGLSTEPVLIAGFGSSDLFASGGRKTFAWLYQDRSPRRICLSSDAMQYRCRTGRDIIVVNLPGERKDTCYGDSGGPMLARLGFEVYALVGVTRRGIYQEDDLACGAGGIYVHLSSPFVGAWLAFNIGNAPV
ncbi:MAG: trypsin-like serine protease [Bauldia sp.]